MIKDIDPSQGMENLFKGIKPTQQILDRVFSNEMLDAKINRESNIVKQAKQDTTVQICSSIPWLNSTIQIIISRPPR